MQAIGSHLCTLNTKCMRYNTHHSRQNSTHFLRTRIYTGVGDTRTNCSAACTHTHTRKPAKCSTHERPENVRCCSGCYCCCCCVQLSVVAFCSFLHERSQYDRGSGCCGYKRRARTRRSNSRACELTMLCTMHDARKHASNAMRAVSNSRAS